LIAGINRNRNYTRINTLGHGSNFMIFELGRLQRSALLFPKCALALGSNNASDVGSIEIVVTILLSRFHKGVHQIEMLVFAAHFPNRGGVCRLRFLFRFWA
jgi:hypothetical protein